MPELGEVGRRSSTTLGLIGMTFQLSSARCIDISVRSQKLDLVCACCDSSTHLPSPTPFELTTAAMAGFSGRCAREIRTLASRRPTTVPRARCFHSSEAVREEDNSRQPGGGGSKGIPFGSQLAFNALKDSTIRKKQADSAPTPPTASDDLSRYSGGSRPDTTIRKAQSPADSTTDAWRISRASSGPRPFAVRRVAEETSGNGPRFAVRRPPPAPGASPSGSRPRKDRSPDVGGVGLPRSPRAAGGASRGGSFRGRGGGGMGSRGGRGGMDGKKKSSGRPRRSGASRVVMEAGQDTEYTYEDYKSGRPVPKSVNISDAEIEYFAERAEQEARGTAFAPDVSAEALVGNGPTTISSASGSGELLHRLLSRSAMPLQPTNASWPTEKAQQLLSGQTVFFHSDEEARNVQDQIKSMRLADLTKYIHSLGPDDKLPKNIAHNLSSFGDIKYETVAEKDRATVDGAWLAGTYVPPGQGAGKNASVTLETVWKYVARNETYLTDNQKTLAKKVASLVPSKRLPAAAAKAKTSSQAGQAKQTARP